MGQHSSIRLKCLLLKTLNFTMLCVVSHFFSHDPWNNLRQTYELPPWQRKKWGVWFFFLLGPPYIPTNMFNLPIGLKDRLWSPSKASLSFLNSWLMASAHNVVVGSLTDSTSCYSLTPLVSDLVRQELLIELSPTSVPCVAAWDFFASLYLCQRFICS